MSCIICHVIGSTDLRIDIAPGPGRDGWMLTPQGELALHTRFQVRAATERVLGHAPLLVAVDLRALTFIDGAGIASLIAAAQRCSAQGVRCVIVRGGGQIGRLIEITGLGDLVEVIDGVDLLRLADPVLAAA